MVSTEFSISQSSDDAFHGYVRGRVQGVFFRAETRNTALRLGLTGWVRNTPDGAVELLVQGKPSALQAMRDWLAKGPQLARVDALELEACEPPALSGFEIRR